MSNTSENKMSIYIEKPSDKYKGQLVRETIKILQRDYGIQNPTQIQGGGRQIYILSIPPELNFEKTRTLNALVRKLRKEQGIRAGIVDIASEVLIRSIKQRKL